MEYALFAFFLLYILPWVMAEARGHERATLVLLANLAVGWTGIGWIACLWWARKGEVRPPPARHPQELRVLPGGGSAPVERRRPPQLRTADARTPLRAAEARTPRAVAPVDLAQSGSEKATSESPRRVPARACPPAATTT